MVQSWNVLEKQCWKQSREVRNTVLNFKWLTFGFVNYLSKFMPCPADVSQPLHDLKTKEANFLWSPQQEAVFDKGKQLVVYHSVLKNYNPQAELTLQCDGSEKGLGATSPQNGQPVAFASRTLSQTERNYAKIKKECLWIVFCCHCFD